MLLLQKRINLGAVIIIPALGPKLWALFLQNSQLQLGFYDHAIILFK